MRRFPSAARAVEHLLHSTWPVVLGIGEVHKRNASARVVSALTRFQRQLLPALARHATDLVVETWVTEGRCGATERKVARKVDHDTERPPETENEVVRLLRTAKQRGVRPHILTVGCDEYAKLLDANRGGKLDHEALLDLVTRHLRLRTQKALAARRAAIKRGRLSSAPRRPPLVLIYGGALHNDLTPPEGLEMFSYAAPINRLSGGRYVELDLYVPELVQDDETVTSQRWYRQARPLLGRHNVVLVRRSAASYVLFLRAGLKQ